MRRSEKTIRDQIKIFFALGLDDDAMAARMGIPVRDVSDTRRYLGIKRPRGRAEYLKRMEVGTTVRSGDDRKTNTFKNIRFLKIITAFAKQVGGKNMSEVAREFNVTREYVRQVVDLAIQAEILDKRGFFTHWNIREQLNLTDEEYEDK